MVFGKKKKVDIKNQEILKSFQIAFDSSKQLNNKKIIGSKAQNILSSK